MMGAQMTACKWNLDGIVLVLILITKTLVRPTVVRASELASNNATTTTSTPMTAAPTCVPSTKATTAKEDPPIPWTKAPLNVVMAFELEKKFANKVGTALVATSLKQIKLKYKCLGEMIILILHLFHSHQLLLV